MSFEGSPAMTSSQQDLRRWEQSRVLSPGVGRQALPDLDYPNERFSDRESNIGNLLNDRFSDPESSVVGDSALDTVQHPGFSWCASHIRSNDSTQYSTQHDPVQLPLDVYHSDMGQTRLTPSRNESQIIDAQYRNPDLNEIIDYLRDGSDAVKAHAAAYLQHLTYLDDNIKKLTRSLNGIRALVDLVSNPVLEVHRAGCGTLRNLSFGKNNDENKREIKNAGGIEKLVKLLRMTTDNDVRELVTGILWNLSSCSDLKRPVINECLKTIVDFVIKPGAGWQQTITPSDSSVGDFRSTVFRNASGVLRNVSSDGEYARSKLRECDGLLDALIIVLRTAISSGDIDNKSVENCVCILRNMSYACQEIIDPNYLNKRTASSRTTQQDETSGCFAGMKKKVSGKDSKTNPPKRSAPDERIFRLKEKALWQPEIVNMYLPLLHDCTNPDTLEAAVGAIQNLAAGDWEPAIDIRTTIRQEKGLAVIVDLLGLNSDRVVCAAATALRNLALDSRNKELIGKYSMQQLVSKLPTAVGPSDLQLVSNDTITAVECALYEIIKTNSTHAKSLMTEGGIERLMFIVHSPPNEYSEKAVKFASQLLVKMWQFTELHDDYKRRGWRQADFLGTSGTGFKSQPPSADNTISRAYQSQSGPSFIDTTHIERQRNATSQLPAYDVHAGSTSSLARQPYIGTLQPRVNTTHEASSPTDHHHTSTGFYPSNGLQTEAVLAPRLPVYDAVSNHSEEPPGYNVQGIQGNNGGVATRFPQESDVYRSNRNLGMELNGYARDGGPSARFTGNIASPRHLVTDASFDSQRNASPYSMQDIREGLSPDTVRSRVSLSYRNGLTAGAGYGEHLANQYPRDRVHEPVYAHVQKSDRFGDVLSFDHGTEQRVTDIDSWV